MDERDRNNCSDEYLAHPLCLGIVAETVGPVGTLSNHQDQKHQASEEKAEPHRCHRRFEPNHRREHHRGHNRRRYKQPPSGKVLVVQPTGRDRNVGDNQHNSSAPTQPCNCSYSAVRIACRESVEIRKAERKIDQGRQGSGRDHDQKLEQHEHPQFAPPRPSFKLCESFEGQHHPLHVECLSTRRLAAVAQRFGDVDAADFAAPRQIGDRAGDAEDTRIAARGKPHRLGGLGEQLAAGLVGRCH